MTDKSRRKESRKSGEGTADVMVTESPFPEQKDLKLNAAVVEVSDSGLRLECGELLDQCTLEIAVSIAGGEVTLRGEVRWVSFDEDGNYELGVELVGNEASILETWQDLIKAL